MPVTLIKGPINSGKTSRAMEALEKTLKMRSGIYIAPSEATANEQRTNLLDRLASDGMKNPALLGNLILSWQNFISSIAEPRAPVFPAARISLFVYELLSSTKFKFFKMRKPSIGIAENFTDTIIALKKNGIDVSKLTSILETRGSLKENDLLRIYDLYEKEHARHDVLDDGDLLNMALEKINTGAPNFLKGIDTIIIDEFCHFKPCDLAIITALKKHSSANILITFPETHSKESIYFNFLKKGLTKLEKIADSIVSLEDVFTSAPRVNIVSTRSPIQEARFAAREISSKKGDIVLVTQTSTPFPEYFADEAINFKIIEDIPSSTSSNDSPVIHNLLSSSTVDLWPPAATVDEYIDLCERYFEDGNIIKTWTDEIKSEPLNKNDIARNLSAVFKFEDILKNMRITAGAVKTNLISRETFVRLIMGELFSALSNPLSSRNLPFRLVPFNNGLSLATDNLVIPHMLEGVIPRPESQRLFFADNDTLSPSPDTIIDEIFQSGEDSLAEDAYLFDTFVSMVRKEILFIYPIINDGGKETEVSSFLDPYPKAIPAEPVSLSHSVNNKGSQNKFDLSLQIETERAKGEITHPEYHGNLNASSAKELVKTRFTKGAFSATSLEHFAECPFRFFAEKVLGLAPPDDETPEIYPRDRGTIIHAVLERFFKENAQNFQDAIHSSDMERDLRAIINKIIDEVTNDNDHRDLFDRQAAGLKPFQTKALQIMAWQVIKTELDEARSVKEPLTPSRFEWEFGLGSKAALLLPVDGDEPAIVRGCIDRIDTDKAETRFLIVDYKSGKKGEAIRGKIMKGLHLQLPIYVEAARTLLFKTALPLGGLLLYIQEADKKQGFVKKEFKKIHYDTGRTKSALEDDEWDAAIAHALGAVSCYVRSIRAGEFSPQPSAGKCQDYCKYEDCCRYEGKTLD